MALHNLRSFVRPNINSHGPTHKLSIRQLSLTIEVVMVVVEDAIQLHQLIVGELGVQGVHLLQDKDMCNTISVQPCLSYIQSQFKNR